LLCPPSTINDGTTPKNQEMVSAAQVFFTANAVGALIPEPF